MNGLNLIKLLSDPSKLRAGVQVGMLLPAMIPTIQAVYAIADLTADERKQAVLIGVARMTDLLTERGFVAAEFMVGLGSVADGLYDIVLDGLETSGVVQR